MTKEEREKWLIERAKSLGGSDMAAIIGLDDKRTPLDVWKSKVYQLPDDGNNVTERGNILEPFVGEWYADNNEIGFLNKKYPDYENLVYKPLDDIYHLESNPICGASIDYFKGSDTVLECKTTQKRFEGYLKKHFIQGQYYCGITGRPKLIIAYAKMPYTFNNDIFVDLNIRDYNELRVLRAALEYEQYDFDFDSDLFAGLVEIATTFWNKFVLTKTPPPPQTISDIQFLFPKSTKDKALDADFSTFETVQKIKKLKYDMKENKNSIEKLQVEVAKFMQDAKAIRYDGNLLCTYKSDKNGKRIFRPYGE
jgi:predicted phage-related endonuclease